MYFNVNNQQINFKIESFFYFSYAKGNADIKDQPFGIPVSYNYCFLQFIYSQIFYNVNKNQVKALY